MGALKYPGPLGYTNGQLNNGRLKRSARTDYP